MNSCSEVFVNLVNRVRKLEERVIMLETQDKLRRKREEKARIVLNESPNCACGGTHHASY